MLCGLHEHWQMRQMMSMENPRRDSGGSDFGDNNKSLFGSATAASSSDLSNSASAAGATTAATATAASSSKSISSLSTPSTTRNVTLMSVSSTAVQYSYE